MHAKTGRTLQYHTTRQRRWQTLRNQLALVEDREKTEALMIAIDIMRDMLYTGSTMLVTQGPDSKRKQAVNNTTFTTKNNVQKLAEKRQWKCISPKR